MGLLLLSVLGRNPLVAVLAIAIPYGAITARVYADLIDESAMGTHRALRASGAGRLVSVLYGVLPDAGRDLVSYGFYRFECSLRSAVILGMIGAGGLGFQPQLSFRGLAYSEMWTCIYALVFVGVIAEAWGRMLRSPRLLGCGSHLPGRWRADVRDVGVAPLAASVHALVVTDTRSRDAARSGVLAPTVASWRVG